MPTLIARCPSCARPCEQVPSPTAYPVFACDNCERGDVGGVAGGPLTFSQDEAAEAQAARRSAREAWDAAARAFNASRRHIAGGSTFAFELGCIWQSAAHEAGLGRVERPATTAYPAAWQEAA